MKTVLLILVIICFVKDSFGYCYIQPFEDTKCTSPTGVTIPQGGELLMPEKCEKCTCSTSNGGGDSSILSCCGYGKNAGVFAPPMGCKVITGNDGCSVKIVQIGDETLSC